MKKIILTLLLLAAVLLSSQNTRAADDLLATSLEGAKAGQTVTLPAGEFIVAPCILPAGVSLRGAGYDKTILRFRGQTGLLISNSPGTNISDLGVYDAAGVGINIEKSSKVLLSRVRVMNCLTGIMISASKNIRLENCVAAENRTGVVMNNTQKSVVVNCTLARNSALGLSITADQRCAIFNNLFASNGIGINLGEHNKELTVDNNVYWGALVGKGQDIPMPSLRSWVDMERQDAHSAFLAIKFVNAEAGNYQPINTLPWAPDRAITDGWGVTNLAGFAAPKDDINRMKWLHGTAAGAWEAKFTAPLSADGYFTVTGNDGYKSAGLYDSENKQVAILFNLLPLAKGKYPFWLPAHDWQGRPIPAGKYELRLVEANISLKYLSSPGNNGVAPVSAAYASTGINQLLYDSQERPVLALNWSESYQNLRGMDESLQQQRWSIPGCARNYGAATDGHGKLYSLREADAANYNLMRVDEENGKIDEVSPGIFGLFLKKEVIGAEACGIAVLNDRVYLAIPAANSLRVGSFTDAEFATVITVPSPRNPYTDFTRKLIWLVSAGENILALDAQGTIKYSFTTGLTGIQSVAVNANRMALLSTVSGKIHLYDITDPAKPNAVGTIGTGDGPAGPFDPARFIFQNSKPEAIDHARVALDSKGTVAVTDIYGVKLFNWQGIIQRNFSGIWAQYMDTGGWNSPGRLQLVELSQKQTISIDENSGDWRYESTLGSPPIFSAVRGSEIDLFMVAGQRLAIERGTRLEERNGKKVKVDLFGVSRYDRNFIGTPLLAFSADKGKLIRFDDVTRNINDLANWTQVVDGAGQPLPFALSNISYSSSRWRAVAGRPHNILCSFARAECCR